MKKNVALFAFLFAPALLAQPLTVGIMPNSANTSVCCEFVTNAPWSIVDVAHPATGAGQLNRASVLWSAPCAGAFKLAFLRKGSTPSSFSVVAVRGPFDAAAGRTDVALSPAVNVVEGDLIALVQLKQGLTCGAPSYELRPRGESGVWLSLNDITTAGTLATSAELDTQITYALMAYNANPVLVRVVPAAGSVQGSGAFFRTSLQLFNNTFDAPVTGKLIFHPAGKSGTSTDPSLPFSVGFRQTLSFPDLVAAMGASGLGSLDVVTDGGQELVVTARIFSDAGAAGTSGFTEEGLAPSQARRVYLGRGSLEGVLPLPTDLTNFRMNVGVRTLEAGATLNIRIYDAAGTLLASRAGVTYAANYFEQPTASQFTGVAALPPGGSIYVTVLNGAAFVYGSITDNRTQDSSMRVADLR